MIRKIDHTDLAGESTQQLIKRTFVSVVIQLKNAGQYQTFKVKIPHHTRKVVGVIISHTAMLPEAEGDRIYIGSAPADISNNEIVNLKKASYKGGDKQCFRISVEYGHKLYFALPKRLGSYFYLTINGIVNEFYNPVALELTDPQTGEKEAYLIWESIADEWEDVEVCLLKDQGDGEGSEGDGDEDDEDGDFDEGEGDDYYGEG